MHLGHELDRETSTTGFLHSSSLIQDRYRAIIPLRREVEDFVPRTMSRVAPGLPTFRKQPTRHLEGCRLLFGF